MQPVAAQSFILDKLALELSPSLYYHGVDHTRQVMKHAALIAEKEGVTGKDLDLLVTAAAFHDAGFLETYTGHEEVSCHLARVHLPQFGFADTDIYRICEMIMATRLPHTATDRLSAILCDADLYYLGTDDYGRTAETLFAEYLEEGIMNDKAEWRRQQISFLKSHTYFTATGRELLSARLKKNLAALISDSAPQHKDQRLDIIWTDIVLILAGVIITSFALKGFLVPNHFFDGGVTGISLLIHEVYGFNLAYVIVLANIPFILLSLKSVNRSFAVKTFFCVVLLGLCLLYPGFPVITNDKLLIAVFGGFFLGLGIGLTMRAGCALDGIEVLALYTLRRSSLTITEIILGLNIIIFLVAAFKFGIPTALYSMLVYFIASKTIDYVVEGLEAYTGVTIISGKSELIKYKLVNELGRGITVYKGERGYLPGKFDVHDDCDIIFTVITRLEMRKLKNVVAEVDPKAFVFASTIRETSGGILKRRRAH